MCVHVLFPSTKEVWVMSKQTLPMDAREFKTQMMICKKVLALEEISEAGGTKNLAICTSPLKNRGAIATVHMDKLLLAPITTSIAIKNADDGAAGLMGDKIVIDKEECVVIFQQKVVQPAKDIDSTDHFKDKLRSTFMPGFWFVRESSSEEESNMTMTSKKTNIGGVSIKIPCLVNKRKLKENEELVQYKPPAKRQPVADIAPPAKKGKGKSKGKGKGNQS